MKKQRILAFLFAGLLLAAAACSAATPTPVLVEITRELPATVIVTVMVTPEVTVAPEETVPVAAAPTATAAATAAPQQPANPTGFYTPIEGCPVSQLHVGDTVYVSYGGGANALRDTPDISLDDNIVDYADEGDALKVVTGPQCSFGWLMWGVERVSDGVQGWTPETDGEDWFLLP